MCGATDALWDETSCICMNVVQEYLSPQMLGKYYGLVRNHFFLRPILNHSADTCRIADPKLDKRLPTGELFDSQAFGLRAMRAMDEGWYDESGTRRLVNDTRD